MPGVRFPLADNAELISAKQAMLFPVYNSKLTLDIFTSFLSEA